MEKVRSGEIDAFQVRASKADSREVRPRADQIACDLTEARRERRGLSGDRTGDDADEGGIKQGSAPQSRPGKGGSGEIRADKSGVP